MWFDDVIPGEPVVRESSARHNAVNELLRDRIAPDGGPEAVPRGGTMEFYNASAEPIGRFTAVTLGSVYRPTAPGSLSGRFDGSCIMSGAAATDGDSPWAVATDDIAPGDFGQVIVSGVAPAFFSGSGSYVTPSADGLAAGTSGNALALIPPFRYGGTLYPGLIVIGGGGGGESSATDGYAGIFKMRALSSTQLEIVHGTYPGANYCGHTDVPGLYEIPRTALEVTAPGRQEITLQFFYDRDARRYSFRFCAGNVPEGAVFGIFLGYFRSGSVTQAFRYNTEQYIFGNDWYLR